MPIGKNAIKRVENNGYSKVKTAAPDMENSTVIANVSQEVMEKMVKPVEKKAAKKTACKKTAAKAEPAKTAPVKVEEKKTAKPAAKKAPAKKVTKKPEVKKVDRVELGSKMPYYLL